MKKAIDFQVCCFFCIFYKKMDNIKFPSEEEEKKYKIKSLLCELLFQEINHSSSTPMDPIVEMTRLNKKDTGAVSFPRNKFAIRIWSNDHNPPHFHVIAEGWDLSFLIENGELYRVNTIGDNMATYNYIVKQVPKWLKMRSKIFKHNTNQEVAENIWSSYDENCKF